MSKQRLRWTDLPDRVRAQVTERVGGPVRGYESLSGGFSKGLAGIVRHDGGRLFIKAVSDRPNPYSPHLYRQERDVHRHLPATAPMPPLRWSFELDEWVVLAFSFVSGASPTPPWDPATLDRALDTILASALTHTPAPAALPTVVERFADDLTGWRALASSPDRARADVWSARHADRFASREARWTSAARGDSLLHGDLRADNLVTGPGGLWLVDWAYACRGAPVFDLVYFLVGVAADGDVDPDTALHRHLDRAGASPDAADTILVALVGWFTYLALRPPPPGIADLRPFQARMAAAGRDWLRRRTGLD
jgi:hypothetical protein